MCRKINIMQVSFGMGIGGMEKVITDLCHYADRDRYNMMVCCTNVKGELGEKLAGEGYPVFICSQKQRFNKYFRFLQVARFLKENKVDIVHSHSYACVDGIMGGVFAKTPIRIHTDHCKNYPDNKRYMVSEKVVSNLADQFVAVSEHTKNDLVKWEGIDPKKICVIYNGMNFANQYEEVDIRRVREEFGLRENEKIIGSVGRLEYQKGYDLLIESASKVISKCREARFVIVGGGSKETELRRQIARLEIGDKVLLTGWRLDASSILQLFEFFIMTSNFEGMPIVLLEAMASGKPIITTRVGGVPEIVKNRENGLWLYERDSSKLASMILSLLGDDSQRRQMGQDGLRRYQTYYKAEKMAENYSKIYEKFLCYKKIK